MIARLSLQAHAFPERGVIGDVITLSERTMVGRIDPPPRIEGVPMIH